VHTIRFCFVVFGVTSSLAVIHTICGISRVRAIYMLLMGVAYIFFTTTMLLLVYLPLNSINQHQDSNMKCV